MPNRNRSSIAAPLLVAASAAGLLLTACGSSDDTPAPLPPPPPASFELTLTNLTAGQPLSPLVAIAHDGSFALMTIGEPASVELERLAEGAETDPLVAVARASAMVSTTAVGTGGPVAPGASTTVSFDVPQGALATAHLSLATMLVNTNDAIAALDGQAIGALAVGESMSVDLASYDTGTEANSESADTIPGPAGAGGAQQGFNAARDDIGDAVHAHSGAVTAADGLVGSALTALYRWDNPVARVRVRRTQ